MRTLAWTTGATAAAAIAVIAASCGGSAVIDGGEDGGGGNAGSAGDMSTTTTSPTGPSGCDDHSDCPGGVCLFDIGQCADACGDACEPCGAGEVCDDCATGSCPGCKDCVPACIPVTFGRCDSHDDCEGDEVCLYGEGVCAPQCDSPKCADPNVICVMCATSSCPCCRDCEEACLPL